MGEISPALSNARAIASDHLQQIASLFRDGAKLTLVVRNPEHDDRDFILSNDDIAEAIKALGRHGS